MKAQRSPALQQHMFTFTRVTLSLNLHRITEQYVLFIVPQNISNKCRDGAGIPCSLEELLLFLVNGGGRGEQWLKCAVLRGASWSYRRGGYRSSSLRSSKLMNADWLFCCHREDHAWLIFLWIIEWMNNLIEKYFVNALFYRVFIISMKSRKRTEIWFYV